MKYYKNNNINYITLDSFSSCAYNKILPLVRNNPELFKVVYSPKQFNLPENYIKNLNQLFLMIDNYRRQTKKIFVPTVVLKVKM